MSTSCSVDGVSMRRSFISYTFYHSLIIIKCDGTLNENSLPKGNMFEETLFWFVVVSIQIFIEIYATSQTISFASANTIFGTHLN